jgi:signal transduction histidine kinase
MGALDVAALAQTRPVSNVLTIHAGSVDFLANPVLDAGIRDTLLAGREESVNYFTEYLEFDRFPHAETSRALGDYIARKYRGQRIDLVLAMTGRALQFVLEQRSALFPHAAIVGAAIGMGDAGLVGDIGARLTGVRIGNAFVESARLALQLHPGTKEMFVIATSPNRLNEESVRAELSRLGGLVAIKYLAAESMDELLTAVRRVPRGSVILYIWYQLNGADYLNDPRRAPRLVAAAAKVPVYGVVDSLIGTGLVGGMVRDTRRTGAAAGAMARQILDGTPPHAIPLADAPLLPMFDWQHLQRWRIDPARLPAGSDVRFKEPTVWERYGGYIIAAGLVMSMQLVLIGGLLKQRSSRRQAELALGAREEALRTSLRRIRRMAGHLIRAQEAARTEIARDLHDDVCQGLVAISMTVSGLKRSPGLAQDKRARQALTQLEKAVVDAAGSVRRLSHDLHPASLRLVGLIPALKGHCAEIEKRHDVQATLQARGDFADVMPEVAVCLFRIVQESLRNGITHGRARRLAVSLARHDGIIEMIVTDDGRGFDLSAVQSGGDGLGLVSIEERAHVVGGHARIISERNRGTTIHVRVPVAAGPRAATDEVPVSRALRHQASFGAVRRALQALKREGRHTTGLIRTTQSLIASARTVVASRVGDAEQSRRGHDPSPTSVKPL